MDSRFRGNDGESAGMTAGAVSLSGAFRRLRRIDDELVLVVIRSES